MKEDNLVTTERQEKDAWALESGLPNDVDGWMFNSRFGTKDEYAQAVMAGGETEGVPGLMFITDLFNNDGEMIGSQGWSVGSGWIPSDDGKSMRHPTRANVVDTSRYGQLQKRVMVGLKVDMNQYGKPTMASSWDGLGFHWLLEEHSTIEGKDPKRGLMPGLFLNRKESSGAKVPATAAPGAAKAEATEGTQELTGRLKQLASVSPNASVFQKAALKMEAVTQNDDLMAQVLDEGPNGFYQQNKGS